MTAHQRRENGKANELLRPDIPSGSAHSTSSIEEAKNDAED
jgi:hypothetical protein